MQFCVRYRLWCVFGSVSNKFFSSTTDSSLDPEQLHPCKQVHVHLYIFFTLLIKLNRRTFSFLSAYLLQPWEFVFFVCCYCSSREFGTLKEFSVTTMDISPRADTKGEEVEIGCHCFPTSRVFCLSRQISAKLLWKMEHLDLRYCFFHEG